MLTLSSVYDDYDQDPRGGAWWSNRLYRKISHFAGGRIDFLIQIPLRDADGQPHRLFFDRIVLGILRATVDQQRILFTGVLGGYTTFSTFARENVQFLKAGEPLSAVSYILISNLFGLTLVAAGFLITSNAFNTN